jgi:dihydropyrimidinase
VIGETCPQYLLFTEDELERLDGRKWVCSPPLRTKNDQVRIWEGLQKDILQTIATDHCPFFYDGTKPIKYEGKEIAIPGKELGINNFTKIPNGLPGVGDRLPIMWTKMVSSGEFSIPEFSTLTSTNPAKYFGLYPQKGALMLNSDADIILWDPEKSVKYGLAFAHHRTDHNLYEGWMLKGFTVQVYSRGRLIVKDGEWLGQQGWGKFIYRQKFRLPV